MEGSEGPDLTRANTVAALGVTTGNRACNGADGGVFGICMLEMVPLNDADITVGCTGLEDLDFFCAGVPLF